MELASLTVPGVLYDEKVSVEIVEGELVIFHEIGDDRQTFLVDPRFRQTIIDGLMKAGN